MEIYSGHIFLFAVLFCTEVKRSIFTANECDKNMKNAPEINIFICKYLDIYQGLMKYII